MYKVKSIKDYGQWCKLGQIYLLENERAIRYKKIGVIKIIEYLGDKRGNKKNANYN